MIIVHRKMVLKLTTGTSATLVCSLEAHPHFSILTKFQQHFGLPIPRTHSLATPQLLQELMDSGQNTWKSFLLQCQYWLMSTCRYDLDNHPSGASYTTSVCPNKETFGTFVNNTAHTCNEFGLRIWETYLPYVS